MIRLNKKIIVSLIVSTQLSLVYAESSLLDDAKATYSTIDSLKIKHWNDGKIYIDAQAQYAQSFWDPGLSDEDPNNSEHIITYETEGLGYYKLKVDVGYSGNSIFTYSKFDSIIKSEKQSELLETNKEAEGGLDGYTMGFSPEAIVDKLGIDNKIISTILTYKFKITDTAFFGVATAESDFKYYTNSDVGTLIKEGDTIRFKTTFKEQRHTVSAKYLIPNDLYYSYPNLRIGFYSAEWTKPTSFRNKRENSIYAIELAEYKTKGVIFTTSNYNGTRNIGLNYHLGIDFGLDNSFISYNSDMEDDLAENESLSYFAAQIDISYKYLLLNTKYNRLSMIFGLYMDYKKWSIADGDDNDDNNVQLDAETLYKAYTSVSYRFAY